MAGLFLSKDEISELTHFKRNASQADALRIMGIEHKVRPDGTLLVLRSHVEKILDGNINANTSNKTTIEPNWSCLHA